MFKLYIHILCSYGKIGMEVENYIFDFDGTLADSEQCNMIATQ